MHVGAFYAPNVYFGCEPNATHKTMCPVLSPGSCWTRDLWSQMAPVSCISESKLPTPTQSTLCHDTCSKVLEIRTLGPREHEPLNLLQSDCRWRPQTSRNPNVARCKIQVWESTENPWKSMKIPYCKPSVRKCTVRSECVKASIWGRHIWSIVTWNGCLKTLLPTTVARKQPIPHWFWGRMFVRVCM